MSKAFDALRELSLSAGVSASAFVVGYDLSSPYPDKEFRVNFGALMAKLSPSFEVAAVNTGAPGSQATATLTQDGDGVWQFEFSIPRGVAGADGSGGGGGGTAVSFVNGNVTKLAAGQQPTAAVRKIDDTTYAIDLGLPVGADGAAGTPGLQGAPGDAGPRGEPGQTGQTGATPTLQAGNVTALAAGAAPTVALRALGGNAYALDIGIPAGAAGAKGADGAAGANGVGVPTGGTTGQILSKKSATDFDTEWKTPAASGGGSGGGVTPGAYSMYHEEFMWFNNNANITAINTEAIINPAGLGVYNSSGSKVQVTDDYWQGALGILDMYGGQNGGTPTASTVYTQRQYSLFGSASTRKKYRAYATIAVLNTNTIMGFCLRQEPMYGAVFERADQRDNMIGILAGADGKYKVMYRRNGQAVTLIDSGVAVNYSPNFGANSEAVFILFEIIASDTTTGDVKFYANGVLLGTVNDTALFSAGFPMRLCVQCEGGANGQGRLFLDNFGIQLGPRPAAA